MCCVIYLFFTQILGRVIEPSTKINNLSLDDKNKHLKRLKSR
ncbi:MAG: hypothetical protein ACJAS4_002506 [Bacteriovoracaceae bacterium]|jgi:hypothetical protein